MKKYKKKKYTTEYFYRVAKKSADGHRYRRKLWALSCFNSKCGICHYDYCISALEFHHLNPDEKEFTISHKKCSLEQIKEELKKCVCLCCRCHREVHSGMLTIPENIQKYIDIEYIGPIQPKPNNNCERCSKEIKWDKKYCSHFCAQRNREKIKWPSDSELKELVWNIPRSILAKQFGVSDSAINKRCRSKNIPQPGPGYWSKLAAKTKKN